MWLDFFHEIKFILADSYLFYSFYFLGVTINCKVPESRVCVLMAVLTKCFYLAKLKVDIRVLFAYFQGEISLAYKNLKACEPLTAQNLIISVF